MRSRMVFLIGVVCIASLACSSGYSTPSSPSPSGSTGNATSGNTASIAIVGSSGSQAFAPNPAQAASGTTVVWRNNDSVVHEIVMDDGSGGTGLLSPQASGSIQLKSSSVSYHCTIHPSMVGTINITAAAATMADAGR
jgi:plastocyanin